MAKQTFEFKEENHFVGFTDPSKDIKLNIGGFSKQITAVEWLAEKLIHAEPNILEWDKYIKQAKQMEKEQIMKAWYNGFEENRPHVDYSEEYYNKTYGENKD